jgi:SOS-response transcriptional repressor LexA
MATKPRRRSGRDQRKPWELEDIERLNALWEKRPQGLTQAMVAQEVGADRSVVSQHMHGDTALNWKWVLAYSKALGVAPAEISPTLAKENMPAIPYQVSDRNTDSTAPYSVLTAHAYQPQLRPLPVIARVIAGNFRDAIPASTPDGEPWTEPPRFSRPSPQAVWLVVDGTSMDDGSSSGFREGDLILVDPDAPWDSGDYVILANGSDEWTFKRVRKDGPTWYMEAINPEYRPRVREIPEGWRVVAKVLEMKSGRKVG